MIIRPLSILPVVLSFAWVACSAEDEGPGRAPTNGLGAGNPTTPTNGVAPVVPGGAQSDEPLLEPDEPAPTPMAEDCDNMLEVTYRDFKESHPDFEMDFPGDVVRLQLVEAELGSDKKPVFKSSLGCPMDSNNPGECANYTPDKPSIKDKASFDQWYRTEAGVNQEIPGILALDEMPAGSGNYVYDNPDFFPLSPGDGFGVSPAGHHLGKNYLFTTEIHFLFKYTPGQKFTFRGDDDLWIFVNNKLALDLGSMHNAEAGTIDFDAQAMALGITPGRTYPMDVFHAERHTTGSNFRIETNIACFVPVDVQGAK